LNFSQQACLVFRLPSITAIPNGGNYTYVAIKKIKKTKKNQIFIPAVSIGGNEFFKKK